MFEVWSYRSWTTFGSSCVEVTESNEAIPKFETGCERDATESYEAILQFETGKSPNQMKQFWNSKRDVTAIEWSDSEIRNGMLGVLQKLVGR